MADKNEARQNFVQSRFIYFISKQNEYIKINIIFIPFESIYEA